MRTTCSMLLLNVFIGPMANYNLIQPVMRFVGGRSISPRCRFGIGYSRSYAYFITLPSCTKLVQVHFRPWNLNGCRKIAIAIITALEASCHVIYIINNHLNNTSLACMSTDSLCIMAVNLYPPALLRNYFLQFKFPSFTITVDHFL